ncbi:hypothetical protein ACFE04_023360 [Oxalis oulophora]
MGYLKISLTYTLTVCVCSLLLSTVHSITNYEDLQALKHFKSVISPDSVSQGSCISSWDFSYDPCDNLFSDKFTCGFRCDNVTGESARVTELSLDQAGYTGQLSSLSFNFPYLETLDLSNNYFHGSIPDSVANMTRLRRLVLSRNSFEGPIPDSVGKLTLLEELYLDNNNLEGTIPSSFNSLKSSKRVELQGNKLNGELPELSKLSELNFLDFSDNQISGTLNPSKLPTSLLELSIRNNSLQGTIPNSVKDLNNLQVLDLSHNQLSNSVPSFLFTHPSLQQLTLSFNKFSTLSQPSLTEIYKSQLIAVDLSHNMLQGFLPLFMGLMPRLSALSLENNYLTGMIPTQYVLKTVVPGSETVAFERLLLGGNYLFGPIPGLLMEMEPGSANVDLGGNCLFRCPVSFFFCQSDDQKSVSECKTFGPVIPRTM